jgi:deazaflavin-dependent oxidoreductase (nitroreductase family)
MDISPAASQRLRDAFKLLNRIMVLHWRLGLGGFLNGTRWGGAYMIIGHTGRRSGRTYRTPVNYTVSEGDIFCTAGFGRTSDWYRNLLAAGGGEIWLPDGRWAVSATDAGDHPQRIALLRQVLIASGFAALAFGVDPGAMSDDVLEQLLQTYRLVRLRRVAPLTGPGGPGDLAWLWPLISAALLLALLRKEKRH